MHNKLDKIIKLCQELQNSHFIPKSKDAIIHPTGNNASKEKELAMTATTKTPKELAQAHLDAERSNSAGKKAASTRAINAYVQRRVSEGSDENRIRAGVNAIITKLKNS